jgi:phospholipid/cholesterol/gamma-HCH transport system ATP-binding protein
MDEQVKIKVSDLRKSFRDNNVLRGVNLDIHHGESMVVIGGSGSGKSVLIKCIIGLLRADSGSILVDGEEVIGKSESELMRMRQQFGMLFQAGALFDSLSVWENVGFGVKRLRGLKDREVRGIATEKLRLVGLKDVEDLRPSELSGGMQKRVSLARALAMEPEILFYDEPTTGLDPIMADMINELIVDLKRKIQVTSIAITHDMKSAYKIADRIAMLYKGEIIEIGTPAQVMASKNEIVQQFIQGKAEGPIKFS